MTTIRLCAYWNEIEAEQGIYNFKKLDWIINAASQSKREIILAVGMKAPRYPEFHLPTWLSTKNAHTLCETEQLCRKFTKEVLTRYQQNPSIKYLQIENEPLNNMSITENRTVTFDFYLGQIKLARTLARPDQKILLTNAINIVPLIAARDYDKAFYANLNLGDAVGTNVYTKIGIKYHLYAIPFPSYWWKLQDWAKLGKKTNTELWITEAQSEPWEDGNMVHTSSPSFPSASPKQTQNLVSRLNNLGYSNILLWGCEHWFWHKKQGRDEWWNTIAEIMQKQY